jgi:hypothetical protein
MRIVRWSGPAAIVLRHRGDVTVVIPWAAAGRDLLDLAGLLLTTREYEQFQDAIASCEAIDYRLVVTTDMKVR